MHTHYTHTCARTHIHTHKSPCILTLTYTQYNKHCRLIGMVIETVELFTHTHTHAHSHTHTYTHTRTHAHTHTHTHTHANTHTRIHTCRSTGMVIEPVELFIETCTHTHKHTHTYTHTHTHTYLQVYWHGH